jgi:hypothetical protein
MCRKRRKYRNVLLARGSGIVARLVKLLNNIMITALTRNRHVKRKHGIAAISTSAKL